MSWILNRQTLQTFTTQLDLGHISLKYAKAYFEGYGVKIKARSKDQFLRELSRMVKDKGRMYHVVRINERTGKKITLSATPMTHQEAVTFKSKQTEYEWARDQLEEVLTETAKAKEDKTEEPTKV
jgi:hypothetical protein